MRWSALRSAVLKERGAEGWDQGFTSNAFSFTGQPDPAYSWPYFSCICFFSNRSTFIWNSNISEMAALLSFSQVKPLELWSIHYVEWFWIFCIFWIQMFLSGVCRRKTTQKASRAAGDRARIPGDISVTHAQSQKWRRSLREHTCEPTWEFLSDRKLIRKLSCHLCVLFQKCYTSCNDIAAR